MSGNLVQEGRRGTLGRRVLLGGPPPVRGAPPPPPPLQPRRQPPQGPGGIPVPVRAPRPMLPPDRTSRKLPIQIRASFNYKREIEEGRTGDLEKIPKRFLSAAHALNHLLQEVKFVWIPDTADPVIEDKINLHGAYPNAKSQRITPANMQQIIDRIGFTPEPFVWNEPSLLGTRMNSRPDIIGALIEVETAFGHTWASVTKNNMNHHRPVCGPGYKWAFYNSALIHFITCDDDFSHMYDIYNNQAQDRRSKPWAIRSVIIVINNKDPAPNFRVISGANPNSNVEDNIDDGVAPVGRLEAAASVWEKRARLKREIAAFKEEATGWEAEWDATVAEIAGDEAAIEATQRAIRTADARRRVALQSEIREYEEALVAAKKKKAAALLAAARLRDHPHLRSMIGTRAHSLLSQGLEGGRRKTRRQTPVRQTRRIKRPHH